MLEGLRVKDERLLGSDSGGLGFRGCCQDTFCTGRGVSAGFDGRDDPVVDESWL